MIEKFTADGVEYEVVRLPEDRKRKAPCEECEFNFLGMEEPCITCINAIGCQKEGRNYMLRKAIRKSKEGCQ